MANRDWRLRRLSFVDGSPAVHSKNSLSRYLRCDVHRYLEDIRTVLLGFHLLYYGICICVPDPTGKSGNIDIVDLSL